VAKNVHEIRDPIHNFIRLDSNERKVLDSRPFQRLRYIHQLGLTYLLYPGATHRRFEHSLGVMELASRVYDVITNPANIFHDTVRDEVPPLGSFKHQYWRQVLRMAALCHDIGHLPFSHSAEKELLPEGWNHERLTLEIIRSAEMESIWKEIKITSDDVAKLAVGPKYFRESYFSNWEAILSEIITGNSFGVDRMDYLLRDSYHAGVAYGKFDHYRLIDTLRILPKEEDGSIEPVLGIEEGGLHTAESLLLARYFMYTQLYFHSIRRIYDVHLQDFLKEWLPDGYFRTALSDHLQLNDNTILTELFKAADDVTLNGHDSARRIVNREHFKLLYQRNPRDVNENPDSAKAVFNAACDKFGVNNVRKDNYKQGGNGHEFPVITEDNQILSSLELSDTLKNVPIVAVDYIFISPELYPDAEKWKKENIQTIILLKKEENHE
jgi:HD superfamily phosphohydrolase